MTRIIAIPLGYILKALYGFLGNYALTIILFTIIIRLIILPLYAAQMRSTQQMSEIQPLVKEIQTKYANDRETMGMKMQELYQEHKIRPAMGCLPLLIQLPIIWGLFALLRTPLQYLGDNSTMVLAVHEPFLWVNDLCQPDPIILPIIAGIATFISMKFSMTPGSMEGPTGSTMKIMQYFMPVMIAIMGTQLPAGLTLYWIISYIFQIFQIRITRMMKDRSKTKKKKKKKKKTAGSLN